MPAYFSPRTYRVPTAWLTCRSCAEMLTTYHRRRKQYAALFQQLEYAHL
ncbi:MAG: hypothetical protein HUU38_17685 [Anaerolineales bacterium]|nr:hypothetical protein [Anaerolineales bacterium]